MCGNIILKTIYGLDGHFFFYIGLDEEFGL